jgi:hypothetical protein
MCTLGEIMLCLEIVDVRAGEKNQNLLELQLEKLIHEVDHLAPPIKVSIYHHNAFKTDFSIHLIYHYNKKYELGSPLGLYLTSALKEFGLVSHNMWTEITSHGFSEKQINTLKNK